MSEHESDAIRFVHDDLVGLDPQLRVQLIQELASRSAEMTTASLQAIEERLPWFHKLGPNDRSWITLVAGRGIDGFVRWLDNSNPEVDPTDIFRAAPAAMTRKVSLKQTVDLVRVTIDVVEEQVRKVTDPAIAARLWMGVVAYSREVAFAAAEVYAKAAESRGKWDSRMEALVVDAIVRDEPNAAIISRASTLGWYSPGKVCVVTGNAPAAPDPELELLRAEASRLDLSVLAATQGNHQIVVLGGTGLTDEDHAIKLVEQLAPRFGSGPIVIGEIVDDLTEAHKSARTANSGFRVAPAWPEGPRLLASAALLPERALAGDSLARKTLADEVYGALLQAGADLLDTCVAYLDNSSSVEATARSLFVHANTVRYRLKKIEEATGYSLTDARGAYALRLAITLGRLKTK